MANFADYECRCRRRKEALLASAACRRQTDLWRWQRRADDPLPAGHVPRPMAGAARPDRRGLTVRRIDYEAFAKAEASSSFAPARALGLVLNLLAPLRAGHALDQPRSQREAERPDREEDDLPREPRPERRVEALSLFEPARDAVRTDCPLPGSDSGSCAVLRSAGVALHDSVEPARREQDGVLLRSSGMTLPDLR
jgi:hypothetical protein